MDINQKNIENKEELLKMIKEGVNPIEYIKDETDINFVCSTIAYSTTSEDTYFDDMAELLLKSFVYYLLSKNEEEKTLNKCKEMIEIGINNREKIKNMLDENESSKSLYTGIDIASDKNYAMIYETLKNKLDIV